MPRWHGGEDYAAGPRASAHENASAFGFSIMVTATFGIVAAFEGSPRPRMTFLFAFGAVAGFTLVIGGATKGLRETETEAEKAEIEFFAALMNFVSVLGAVGAATLLAWLAGGWYVWVLAPLAASAAYLLLNGLEFAIAEVEDEKR